MKNLLEQFLEALEIKYTHTYAKRLYNEHPHVNNMYGLKKMLGLYGVEVQGLRVNSENLCRINYPCIFHLKGSFAIGLGATSTTVTYRINSKDIVAKYDEFIQIWTGNTLVVKKTENSKEPNYRQHQHEQFVLLSSELGMPSILLLTFFAGIIENGKMLTIFQLSALGLCIIGLCICGLLMQKQLFGKSRYGVTGCAHFSTAPTATACWTVRWPK